MATVLVVDDAVVDRHLAGSLLEKLAPSPGAGGEWKAIYASHGLEALALMKQDLPDLVLTDLQMPEMDGLQLVEAIKITYPAVPVILMTAHGSEEIAAQALKSGAASYVPKNNLARDLPETVESVMTVTRGDPAQKRLLECLMQTESHFLLENDVALIPPLIGYLEANLLRMKLTDENGLIRVAVALREALINAIHHGNLELSSELREKDEKIYHQLAETRRHEEPYQDRRVHVHAKESQGQAVYVIRDEGRGFDPTTLPDPTDPANLDRVSGRGLLLIRTFMDEVHFNKSGNEITLVKRGTL